MSRRLTAYAVLALALSVGLGLWLVSGGPGAWTPLDGLVGALAILLLAVAVGLANAGRSAEGEPAPAPAVEPKAEPVPGDVGGVRVVLSEGGLSVPFDRGWRDFSGYPAFAADPAFPPGAAELELADPPGAAFGVIGRRGAVFLPDGSILVDADGDTAIYEDLAALFADRHHADLRPTGGSFFVLEFLGHAYMIRPDGTLVPSADGAAAPRGTIAEILADPDLAERVGRYASRARPGRVFGAVGGRPVRLGADGTVEWIRADGIRRFPDLPAAMAAIRAAHGGA